VLKVDVEGNELDVLIGASDLLNKYKPLVIIEVNPKNTGEALKLHHSNLLQFDEMLSNYGYVSIW